MVDFQRAGWMYGLWNQTERHVNQIDETAEVFLVSVIFIPITAFFLRLQDY